MIQLNRIVVLFFASALGAQMHFQPLTGGGIQPSTFLNQANPDQDLVPQHPDGFIQGTHGIVTNLTDGHKCYCKRSGQWTAPYAPRLIAEVPMAKCLKNRTLQEVIASGDDPESVSQNSERVARGTRNATPGAKFPNAQVFIYAWRMEGPWMHGTALTGLEVDGPALHEKVSLWNSDFIPNGTPDSNMKLYWGAGINDRYVIGITDGPEEDMLRRVDLVTAAALQPKKAMPPKKVNKKNTADDKKSLTNKMSNLSLSIRKKQK
jgi:hypothetical protein